MDFKAKPPCRAVGALIFSCFLFANQAFADETIKGQVLGGGAPVANSTVTLWEASAGAPKQLAQTKTNGDGRFEVHSKDAANDTILYLIAAGGTAKKAGALRSPAGLIG